MEFFYERRIVTKYWRTMQKHLWKTQTLNHNKIQIKQANVYFFIPPPIDLICSQSESEGPSQERTHWLLLAVANFEEKKSVSNSTGEINSSSICIPGYWEGLEEDETFEKLNDLKKLRSQDDIEL